MIPDKTEADRRTAVDKLDIHFGAYRAVDQVSFTAERGKLTTLLGPSGCGKSTILRSFAGLIEAQGGRILIDGATVTDPARKVNLPPERRGIGMVFQSYAIWPHMTVFENVVYPLRIRSVAKDIAAAKVKRTLDLVGLGSLADRAATDLSGGQQQRVAIARALAFEPQLLLLDEPLSNLDSKLRAHMGDELRRIQQQTGVTAIYVTHDQTEALALSDRIVVLEKGKVQQIGTPEEIYEQPANPFVSWFVGKTNFLHGTVVKTGERPEVLLAPGTSPVRVRQTTERFELGQQVVVAVRPEDIEIDAADGFDAVITLSEYQGERRRHIADFGGVELEFYGPRELRLMPQDVPRLRIPPDRAGIFSKSDEIPGQSHAYGGSPLKVSSATIQRSLVDAT